MIFKMKVDSRDAAFAEDGYDEVARILRGVLAYLEQAPTDFNFNLYDFNGNACGYVWGDQEIATNDIEEDDGDPHYLGSEDDGDALASAGWGTDEDYGDGGERL